VWSEDLLVERMAQVLEFNKELRNELEQYKVNHEMLRKMLAQCHAEKDAISNRKDAIMRKRFRNAIKKSPKLRAAVRDMLGINRASSQ
jgi:hypothetical protein